MNRSLNLLLTFFMTVSSSALFAISNVNELIETVDDVEIALLTVDRGQLPYMLAGHSLLRVSNKKLGQDLVFNWGIFDLSDPKLPLKILKGEMTYKIGAWPFSLAFQHYVRNEKRTVWQEKINLTSVQKTSVLRQLNWWLSPENTHYQYVIRKHNCSTIIRDILNQSLAGKIKDQFGDGLSDAVYRDHVKEYFPLFTWAHFGFDLVASSELDQKITKWNYMYLPFNLQEKLKEIPAFADNHQNNAAGKMLMSPTVILNEGSKYLPPPVSMWTMSAALVFAMLALGLMLLRKGSLNFVRLTGLLTIGWGMFSAVFALILIVGWSYTTHIFIHHNANLFYFWITDILFVLLGLRMLFRPGKTIENLKLKTLVKRYGILHAAFLAVSVVGFITGLISQDMSYGLIYVAPHLLLCLGFQYLAFKKETFEGKPVESKS